MFKQSIFVLRNLTNHNKTGLEKQYSLVVPIKSEAHKKKISLKSPSLIKLVSLTACLPVLPSPFLKIMSQNNREQYKTTAH